MAHAKTMTTRATGGFGLTSLLVLAGLVSMPQPAAAREYRAKLSRDLAAHLSKATEGSVDVLLTGNAGFIARIANRHGAVIKKSLKTGAVLSLTIDGLRTLADDAGAGVITGDGVLRSQLALVTEPTGAAAAWAGDIAQLGGVIGTGVGIAIIDSGVDRHSALAGRLVASVDFTGGGNAFDGWGHGTHVAGIVAAGAPKNDTGEAPVGMAPGAHIVSLKVLGADGTGRASDAIAALDWAVEHKDQYGLRIINMSIGMAPTQSWRDDPLCQAVERAVRAGLVVVASAGNHGETAEGKMILGGVTSPGISPFAITVGALRTNGTVDSSDDYVAPWSSKGPTAIDHLVKPDLVAPGSKVVSLLAPNSALAQQYPERIVLGTGRSGYFQLSGTSQAAAAVSGAVALLLESQPQFQPLQVKVLLQAAAEPMPEEGLMGAGARCP
jgi:serine protease AprX